MKLRVKMEDFIAEEDDKELAKVAFHRAQRSITIRSVIGFILVIAFSFFLVPILGSIAVWGAILLFCLIMPFVLRRACLNEYHKQLDELKLQMRGKE